MFKKYAEQAVLNLDAANDEWGRGHRDIAAEWYMLARTEALVSIALAVAELVEDGGQLDALRWAVALCASRRAERAGNPGPTRGD